eukprot:CAMPEP_0183719358 /NCGR_PEP_ID=MMETSP0737-20130205/12337_1 /TAXON_ID=385413 /ORGANISM="Thalassiosira miniscula, Strain CCMP1093" /LENGTH=502 /DNA_ID=CAMNT_0025949075 /DNA_START=12 /DNA_END=1520 /DNA_ORIENTATION=+
MAENEKGKRYSTVKVGRVYGYPIVVTQGKIEHEAILLNCTNIDPEAFLTQNAGANVKIRWKVAGYIDHVPANDVRLQQMTGAPTIRTTRAAARVASSKEGTNAIEKAASIKAEYAADTDSEDENKAWAHKVCHKVPFDVKSNANVKDEYSQDTDDEQCDKNKRDGDDNATSATSDHAPNDEVPKRRSKRRKQTTQDSAVAAASDSAGGARVSNDSKKGKKRSTKPKPQKKLNKTDQKWMDMYNRLKEFKTEHGHTHVSETDEDFFSPFANEYSYLGGGRCKRGRIPNDPDRHALVKWISRQRSGKKSGTIRADREKLLDDIDFYWNPNDLEWDQYYEHIQEIMKEEGHDTADIPSLRSHVNEANAAYAGYMAWAEEQRLRYALFQKKHHTTITERRIKKLNEIGFAWYRNDEDKARIEKKAKDANFKWVWRNFLNHRSGSMKQVLAAVKEAKEKHERTGEPCIPMYDSYYLIGYEPDGTVFLMHPSDLEENENKGYTYACFR